MAVADNVINNTARVVDEASSKMASIGKAADDMGAKIAGASAVGDAGMKRLDATMTTASGSFAKVTRGIFDSTEALHMFMARAQGLSSDKIAEFEKRVGELLPQAISKAEKEAVLAASSFRELDKVAEAMLIRSTRKELFSRSAALGPAGSTVMSQVVSAKDLTQLDKAEVALTKLEAKMKKTGDTAQQQGGFIGAFMEKFKKTGVGEGAELLGEGLAVAGGTIVGAGVVMGFEAMEKAIDSAHEKLKEFLDSIKELAFAQREISLEHFSTGLSVETLQTFDFAAKKLGIDVGNLRYAMTQLAAEVEQHPEKFRKAGIAIEDVHKKTLPLDEIFLNLTDAVAGMKDPMDQLTFVSELFTRRMGGRLLPLLVQGREGFERLREEGHKTEEVFNPQSQQSLVAYAQKVADANIAWEGLANRLRIDLLPVMSLVMGAIELSAQAITGWYLQVKQSVMEAIPFKDTVWQLYYGIKALYDVVNKQPKTNIASSTEEQVKAMLLAFQEAGQAAEAAKAVDKFAQKMSDATHQSPEIDKLGKSLMTVWGTGGNVRAELKKLVATLGTEVTGRVVDAAIGFAGLGNKAEELRQKIQGVARTLDDAFRNGAIDPAVKQIADDIEMLGAKGKKASDIIRIEYDKSGKSMETVTAAIAEVARRADLSKALDDAFRGGQPSEHVRELSREITELGRTGASSADIISKVYRIAGTDVKDVSAAIADVSKRASEQLAILDRVGSADKDRHRVLTPTQQSAEEQRKLQESLQKVTDKFAEMGDVTSGIADGVTSVFSTMTSASDAFFDTMDARLFNTRTLFGFVFSTIANEALHQLNRILLSKLFQLALTIFGFGSGAAAGGLVDAPIGDVPIVPVGLTAGGASAAATTVPVQPIQNFITIQSFSPRDVLRDYTSPGGSLRNANTRLAFASEF